MLAEAAEIARNTDLILEADVLVAEEENLIARERVVQLLDLLVGKRPGQVDCADLGSDMGAVRRGGDGFIGRGLGDGGNLRDLRQMRGGAHGALPRSMDETGFAAPGPSYPCAAPTAIEQRQRGRGCPLNDLASPLARAYPSTPQSENASIDRQLRVLAPGW